MAKVNSGEASPVKAGRNVDLNEPRLQSRIQEDVKSKEFIAGVPAVGFGLKMKTKTEAGVFLAIFWSLLISTTPAADILLEERGHVALCTDNCLDHQILQC